MDCRAIYPGVPDCDILAVLLDHNNKISDHIYDQPNPRDCAERQITQAHTARTTDWTTRVIDGRALIAANVTNVLLALREDVRLRHVLGFAKCRFFGCSGEFDPVLSRHLFSNNRNL